MGLEIDQIAKAFCSYRFSDTYPYMGDQIIWNVVGKEQLAGRAAVLDRCEQAAKFLATVSATITKLEIHRAGSVVVVEGAAQIKGQQGEISRVASCDVFRFSDGGLIEITSYVVSLS